MAKLLPVCIEASANTKDAVRGVNRAGLDDDRVVIEVEGDAEDVLVRGVLPRVINAASFRDKVPLEDHLIRGCLVQSVDILDLATLDLPVIALRIKVVPETSNHLVLSPLTNGFGVVVSAPDATERDVAMAREHA